MDTKDHSKTFDDVESDELSLETSVPTDLTLSPDNSERNNRRWKRQATRQIFERKQLSHDLQMLKIDLSQKNMTIDNLKVEHMQRAEELEEKIHELTHQKSILQARLESELQIQEDDAKKLQQMISKELDALRTKQHHLEAANQRLREKSGDVRKSLRDLTLSEEKYYQIKSLTEEELSLRDYVAIQMYEAVKPLQSELDQLKMTENAKDDEISSRLAELLELKKRLDVESEAHSELRMQCQKLSVDYANVTLQLKSDDYKVGNYERVKGERDNLEHDRMDVKRQATILEASLTNIQRERDDLVKEVSTCKQSLSLLRQDKNYLNRQLSEASNRCAFNDEKERQLSRQLEDARQAREEMYEKYVNSRDVYKSDYENKLRDELEQLHLRTNSEVDRLRTSSKEMYERENRNMREARDTAVAERDRLQVSEREVEVKCEQVVRQLRDLQSKCDTSMSSMQNELKVKTFECERSQMVYHETQKNLNDCETEVEKHQKKVEVLTKEYYALQMATEKRLVEMGAQLSDKGSRLEVYERLEKEMDDVILQAADVENDADAEKVLFSYGYGANIPSTAKRRMQHSVQLARRMLELERANSSMRKQIAEEKATSRQLSEELQKSNDILNHVQQPQNYLIECVRSRDNQITKLKQHMSVLGNELRKFEEERVQMVETHNQMALDLDRLLNQREEMAMLKQLVMGLSARQRPDEKLSLDDNELRSALSDIHRSGHHDVSNPLNTTKPQEDTDTVKPGLLSLNRPSRLAKKLTKKKGSRATSFSDVYGTSTK